MGLRETREQGTAVDHEIAYQLRRLPALLAVRQEFREEHLALLAAEGRSSQTELDAEMELLAGMGEYDVNGKLLSVAAKDRELRRLKNTDEAYLAIKRDCRAAAEELARMDNEIEVCRATLSGDKARLAWLTALINMEGE